MNIIDRYKSPTPKFFRILRNIGIAMATAGGTVLASPLELPELVISISAYMTLAGSVASAISQAVVSDEEINTNSKNN